VADDEVPWLTADELQDWIPLMALLMTLQPALDAQLKRDVGLNAFEYMMLAALSEAPKRTMPMSKLAVFSQGSISRVSHAVTRLEAAGWVTRVRTPESGRHTDVHLTSAGWRKLRQAAPGHVREARRLVVDVVTADQLRTLGGSARAIVAVIDPELGAELDSRLGA
jgi:DNA-binding MarR family transcriptional regulator